MIVYEYILDENNNILTIQQWDESEKPEYKNNPTPSAEMINNPICDKFGHSLYRLENNEIIENTIILTEDELCCELLNEKNLAIVIKTLIKGIDNNLDPDFISLKNEVLDI
jgi:hypothetical protein